MLKLLTFGLVIYLSYKFWFQPTQLKKPPEADGHINIKENAQKDGDYIDYEEVD